MLVEVVIEVVWLMFRPKTRLPLELNGIDVDPHSRTAAEEQSSKSLPNASTNADCVANPPRCYRSY
jgi:hypothetical protein